LRLRQCVKQPQPLALRKSGSSCHYSYWSINQCTVTLQYGELGKVASRDLVKLFLEELKRQSLTSISLKTQNKHESIDLRMKCGSSPTSKPARVSGSTIKAHHNLNICTLPYLNPLAPKMDGLPDLLVAVAFAQESPLDVIDVLARLFAHVFLPHICLDASVIVP
jgi:hypothetical protein